MNHAALDAALVLCLGAGAADLVALNLVVLPSTRAPVEQQLGPEAPVRAPAPPRAPRTHQLELAGLAPAPPAFAPAPPAFEATPAPGAQPVAVVEFEVASPRMDRYAAELLGQALAQLRDAHEIVVVGHADSSGPEQLNDQLSARRAEAVAERLFASGIPAAHVRTDARGEREPRAEGNSRRVEIYVGGGT